MQLLITLAQSLGIAYASGISLYATVALVGLGERLAAAVLAVATAWHTDPSIIVLAGLLGGGLGPTTNVAKPGLRMPVDTSPEPVTNGMVNVAELGVVATMSYAIWHHPIPALVLAVVLCTLAILLVRAVWRTVRTVVTGSWRAVARR